MERDKKKYEIGSRKWLNLKAFLKFSFLNALISEITIPIKKYIFLVDSRFIEEVPISLIQVREYVLKRRW